MDKNKFITQYEKMIDKYAIDQQEEDEMYELLEDIEDKLIELEHRISNNEEASRSKLNYEKMNEEFVYNNCI